MLSGRSLVLILAVSPLLAASASAPRRRNAACATTPSTLHEQRRPARMRPAGDRNQPRFRSADPVGGGGGRCDASARRVEACHGRDCRHRTRDDGRDGHRPRPGGPGAPDRRSAPDRLVLAGRQPADVRRGRDRRARASASSIRPAISPFMSAAACASRGPRTATFAAIFRSPSNISDLWTRADVSVPAQSLSQH